MGTSSPPPEPPGPPGRHSTPLRVVLVDDHPLALAGMQAWLARAAGIAVVGTTTQGAEALRLVAQHRPHVLVLDLRLPDLSGLEVARQVRHRAPEVGVLAITGAPNTGDEHSLRQMGVRAYLPKTVVGAAFVQAVRLVARGEPVEAVPVAPGSVEWVVRVVPPLERLTPREHDILRLLARDRSNAEIARTLGLSERTVAEHVSHLLAKCQVHSRTGVVLYALRHGVIALPPDDGSPPG